MSGPPKRYRFPFVLQKRRAHERLLRERAFLASLVDALTLPDPSALSSQAGCIVFSMDRALQLHALLASYFECAAHPVPVSVLYRTTSAAHDRAYAEVFKLFERQPVRAFRQTAAITFKEQVIALLAGMGAPKVFFLTDDDLFIDRFDLKEFLGFDPRTTIASLRLGDHLTYSYPVQQEQPLPEFVPCDGIGDDMHCWVWNAGKLDWAYPLSVDGHLLSTREVLALAAHTDFHSPNTFEANMQAYARYYSGRRGVCYKRSKLLNIPLNKVQVDNENVHGSIHQDHLLEQWNRGLQMDYRSLYGIVNRSAHQEMTIKYLERKG